MFQKFFEEKIGFPPYEYQIKVAETLLSDKNVILVIPTGAGKTWAAVMPFLYAKEESLKTFPQTIDFLEAKLLIIRCLKTQLEVIQTCR